MIAILISIFGIALFTTLLISKQITGTAFCFLMTLTAIVTLAVHGFDRLKEIDLKQLKMTLVEIRETKEEIFAKEKDLKKLAEFISNLIMVDQAIGYTFDSFSVRQFASPLLYDKSKQLKKDLGLPIDESLHDAVQKWFKLEDGEEKDKVWKEIEKIITETIKGI